ncbi:MAG: SCO family protein [Bacteroidia bacterium]|jgi:protein SCO1/2|nr:SCO family protein [Bacteroidia bacterium]
MKHFFLFLVAASLLGCGGSDKIIPVDSIIAGEVDMSNTGLTRLMKYFAQDTTISGNDTIVKYHTIPPGNFITQDGGSYTAEAQRGKVSVNSFFFSTCEGICPIVSSGMSKIHKAYSNNPDLKLVSYTVDPETDNVAALKAYAGRYGADAQQWTFLTGEKKALYDQIRNGFLLPDVKPGTGGEEDFIHSDQIVLVDRDLIIRGFYTGTDSLAVDSLIRDIKLLLEEKK